LHAFPYLRRVHDCRRESRQHQRNLLIDRHPDVRFIVDHLGVLQPSVPPAPPQPWADLPKVLELAKHKNAVIKVTGACTLSREPYPFPDIWDPLARVFDAWGFDRCLWGTDWTRAFAVVNYEQAVEPFLKTDRLSDTERATYAHDGTSVWGQIKVKT
jgi:L-fuconolactonase